MRAVWPAVALALAVGPAAAASPSGLWMTEKGKVAVELYSCDAALCGRIAWMAAPLGPDGEPKRDTRNPDPSLRDRPWCGMTVITGLEPTDGGAWSGGEFYYPKHGRSYDLRLRPSGERLKVRAYLGIEMLGRTETWRRADRDLGGCPDSG